MRFNYKKAWNELAFPAFQGLGQPIIDLLMGVNSEYDHLCQNTKLDLVGATDSLLNRFNILLDSDIISLASASRIIYFTGHWASDNKVIKPGLNWKFSLLADQALRKKFSLFGNDLPGRTIQIHEGFFRICLSSSGTWTWEEVGLAIPEVYEIIESTDWGIFKNSDSWIEQQQTIIAEVKGKTKDIGGMGDWLDTARYME